MIIGNTITHVFNHAHLCAGIGVGAAGLNDGHARIGNVEGRGRCVGGIDVDAGAIANFEKLTGVKGTVLDLFSREQFRAFHEREPGTDFVEALPEDIRRAFGNEPVDVLFTSAPCKGFSGLLPEAQSLTDKYQALNALTLRCIWLALEAYKDDPISIILFENVPRIASRGKALLDRIKQLLNLYGYACDGQPHDCGEVGNLAQSRKRYLLVGRHREKVPPFLYQPVKHKLRGVGEVLGKMPLPGDPRGGSMHRVPRLQWKTWVRLAFVEAGKDWRSLNGLRVGDDGNLVDFGIAPDCNWNRGVLGVTPWGEPSGVVTGNGRPGSGSFAVADPRVDGHPKSVQLGVRRWQDTAACMKGDISAGTGPYAVADPRHTGPAKHSNEFRIIRWDAESKAVTSAHGSGQCVADPRSHSGFGGAGKYLVTPFGAPSNTVIAGSTTGQGAFAVADPRHAPDLFQGGQLGVRGWDQPSPTIIGNSRSPYQGGYSVAAPRTGYDDARKNVMRVAAFGEPAGTVTSGHSPSNGAVCVADPRPVAFRGERAAFNSQGHYGVLDWDEPSGALPAFTKYDRGNFSVADPREQVAAPIDALPGPDDRLVAVIRALDGTWHRPITTLEMAGLQSIFDPEEVFGEDGEGFELIGGTDATQREWIGNAVPRAAAKGMANTIYETLIMARLGIGFTLSSREIWTRPLAIALTVDLPEVRL